jgi:hypothetical protein
VPLDVDCIRIEFLAAPLHALVVAFMIGISECFEELAVAPGSANVLRWATSGRFDQTWIKKPGDRLGDALDPDRVFPAVAKVIEIFERLAADVFQDVDEAGVARQL